MSLPWYKSFVGDAVDYRFIIVAKRAGITPIAVAGLFWVLRDQAGRENPRGSIAHFNCGATEAFFGLEEGTCQRVIEALESQGLIADNQIVSWPEREGCTDAARQQRHRNAQKEKEHTKGLETRDEDDDEQQMSRDVTLDKIRQDKDKDKDKTRLYETQKETQTQTENPTARVSSSSSNNSSLLDYSYTAENVLELWNDTAKGTKLIQASRINQERRDKIYDTQRRFAKEGTKFTLEDWQFVFNKIRSNAFLCGGGKKGFVADFDFAISYDNINKLLNGRYDPYGAKPVKNPDGSYGEPDPDNRKRMEGLSKMYSEQYGWDDEGEAVS